MFLKFGIFQKFRTLRIAKNKNHSLSTSKRYFIALKPKKTIKIYLKFTKKCVASTKKRFFIAATDKSIAATHQPVVATH